MEHIDLKSHPKCDMIIEAAFDEFGEQGYKHASTNRIIERAGISKGLLFYYFKTKEELFVYLVEHSIEFFRENYIDRLENPEPDFIKRCIKLSETKRDAVLKNPHVFKFLRIYFSEDKDVLPEKFSSQIAEALSKFNLYLYSEIDTSQFRRDIPEKTVTNLIKWGIEGYERDLTERLKGIPFERIIKEDKSYWLEYYEFLDNVKKIFYR